MRSRLAVLLMTFATVVAIGAGGTPASAGLTGFANCGKVADEGGRSPVKAANVRCERAVKLASAFIQSDVLNPKWKTYNPAGCEFFMYRKGERREFLAWFADGGSPEIKVIYFVKTRGCVS
jgi:hypothetical protein